MTALHQLHRAAAHIATAPELHAIRDALQACRDEIAAIGGSVADGVVDELEGQIGYVQQEIEDAPMEAMAEAEGAWADYRRDMDHDR